MKPVAVLAALLALAGCNRGSIENKEAVRQGVLDYLAKRTNLSVGSMTVDVTSVTFKGNEADAVVSFTPKGAGAAQGMAISYVLERQGTRWVVKGKADKAGHSGGMGGQMPMPGMEGHGGGMPPPAAMPPGHPSVTAPEKK